MPSPKFLPILLTVAVAAIAPASAQARHRVHGPGFKTFVPSGWKVKNVRANGWQSVVVTSPGTRKNVTRNSVTLSIGSITVKAFRKRAGRALPKSPVELVPLVTSVPQGAAQLDQSIAPHLTKLNNVLAGLAVYTYSFQGTSISQTETVVRHRGRVYVLQLNVDSSLAVVGGAAINMANQNWRWTR